MDVGPNKNVLHNHPFQDMRCGVWGKGDEETSYWGHDPWTSWHMWNVHVQCTHGSMER